MTAEQLASIVGIVLSLVFSYVPGINSRYNALDGTGKRLVMLVLLALVALSVFGLSCAQVIDSVACTKAGATSLVWAFIAALMANQATYLLSPQKAKS